MFGQDPTRWWDSLSRGQQVTLLAYWRLEKTVEARTRAER